MKIHAGWNKKSGRAQFGSEGALIAFEIDVDDALFGDAARHAELIKGARALTVLAKRAVEEEIAIADSAARARAEREAAEAAKRDEDRRAAEERERTETGYREAAPEPAPRRTDYDDHRDSQPEPESDRARAGREADQVAARGERRGDATWGGRGDDRRDDRRNDRGGANNRRSGFDWTQTNKSPRTGKQLFGFAKDHDALRWFSDYAASENLPEQFNDWRPSEVEAAVRAFRGDAAPASNGNGRSNGRSNGHYNGRNDGY
jgi:hypothetical protein